MGTLNDWLNRRKLLKSMTYNSGATPQLPYIVILLGDNHLVEKEAVLPLLLVEGPALGAFTIVMGEHIGALAKECQAVIDVRKKTGQITLNAPTMLQAAFVPDLTPVKKADRIARALAPLRLKQMANSTEIPGVVPLFDLFGVHQVEKINVADRWRSAQPYRSLAVPVGLRAGSEMLLLNLHERGHGPHGLVAGTTGSGKSELLQSIVASLAVFFHPYDVAFVLVDYKGGGMANLFADLPHLVGTLTNLQGNLATRALVALKGEMLRRQAVLAQAEVNHIDDYQKLWRQGKATEPLPHLVIVVDEFAELKMEQPDFIRELISAVRVGRSLGVHLILATQKPAGVVDEQVWSNARFRLCLRVERPEDSQEVIKRPDAASLTQPGRAYFQVGNNEFFELFQSAFSGALYYPEGVVAQDPNEITEVALNGARRSLSLSRQARHDAAGTQLQALVGHLKAVAEREGLRRLPGPWLPPLPEEVSLRDLQDAAGKGWDGQTWQPVSTWIEPTVGIVDNPAQQFQGPLSFNLGKEGHLAVYGAPGSGKTTLLQTLITSLAFDHSPADVHLYLLDFGGRMLNLFAPLPHVGDVILADDEERLNRLMRFLLREMESRKERFSETGVSTLSAYRATSAEQLPAIVVVLDNYTGFVNTYPDAEDYLAQLLREGGNLGIHFVITANSPSAVRMKTSGNITLTAALQLADRGEYSVAVGRAYGLEPAPVLGRGLVKGNPPLEFHTALPASGDNEVARTTALKTLIKQMQDAWDRPCAKPVPILPDVVLLSKLLPPAEEWPVLLADGSLTVPVGLEIKELEPVKVDLYDGPHFLITGPVQSGKSSFLQTWLLALGECYSPERLHLYLIDFNQTSMFNLQRLPQVKAYVENENQLSEILNEITGLLRDRRQAMDEARRASKGLFSDKEFLSGYPAVVIAMDDFDAVSKQADPMSKDQIEQIVRRDRGMGVHVLVAGTSTDLNSSWDGWIKALKELQIGFLLGSSDHSDLQLFNLRLSVGEAGKPLPPGRGYYTRRGRYVEFQAATVQTGDMILLPWIEKIRERVQE
jgi:S-DNA-T family DNA segregation ATPase FtsK/SpoIIIE